MPESKSNIYFTNKVVLDTNVLVSSLMSSSSPPAYIIKLVGFCRIMPCYDAEILDEYKRVLNYPKFAFSSFQTDSLINGILKRGLFINAPISEIKMIDESDRKFYDLRKTANAILITGNIKHYPKEASIMKPSAFIEYFNLNFSPIV